MRLSPLGFCLVVAALVVGTMNFVRAAVLGDVAAMLTGPLAWLVPVVAILLLLGLAWLGRLLSAYLREKTQASQAARLVDTLSSLAQNVALTLLQRPPAPASVLAAVKAAAIAQGVAYAKANLPDTVAALGITDETIAARLNHEVAGVLVAARAPADLATMAQSAVQQAIEAAAPALVSAAIAVLPATNVAGATEAPDAHVAAQPAG